MIVSTRLAARFIAAALLCAGAGCGPGDAEHAADSSMPYGSTKSPNAREKQATLVRVEPLRTGEIRSTIHVITDIEAEIIVDVFPKVGPAYIREVFVKEGDAVDVDQQLLLLDDIDFRLAKRKADSDLAQAKHQIIAKTTALSEAQAKEAAQKAVFEKAELDFKRAKDSLAGGIDVLSQKEFADIQSEFDQRKAEYDGVKFAVDRANDDLESAHLMVEAAEIDQEEAQKNLDHTVVRAPSAGVIQRRDVNAGLLVNSSTHLFTLVDPTRLIANLSIRAVDLVLLREPGLSVEFTLDALPGQKVSGIIEAINPTVDPKSSQARVRARLEPGAEKFVLPGMMSAADIVIGSRADAVLLPKRAVLNENGRQYFFALDGTKVRRHEFVSGAGTANDHDLISVDGNPPSADLLVVVVGQDKLRDGDEVVLASAGT